MNIDIGDLIEKNKKQKPLDVILEYYKLESKINKYLTEYIEKVKKLCIPQKLKDNLNSLEKMVEIQKQKLEKQHINVLNDDELVEFKEMLESKDKLDAQEIENLINDGIEDLARQSSDVDCESCSCQDYKCKLKCRSKCGLCNYCQNCQLCPDCMFCKNCQTKSCMQKDGTVDCEKCSYC